MVASTEEVCGPARRWRIEDCRGPFHLWFPDILRYGRVTRKDRMARKMDRRDQDHPRHFQKMIFIACLMVDTSGCEAGKYCE